MKRELRQQIMKRMVRNMPNLMPFMVGAAVGAVMNRRRDRESSPPGSASDLRKIQVPWEALEALPALERPADALEMGEITKTLWAAARAADATAEHGDQRDDGR